VKWSQIAKNNDEFIQDGVLSSKVEPFAKAETIGKPGMELVLALFKQHEDGTIPFNKGLLFKPNPTGKALYAQAEPGTTANGEPFSFSFDIQPYFYGITLKYSPHCSCRAPITR
jgi:hypothetical protein